VSAWAEAVTIPTYAVGEPDKNPLFLEKRVYQGSSGVVYPYPVIERVADEKEDRTYTALFLENRYLKIMVLPELGGRVQMALDKTNGYHFVYHNRVIKPALVGLAGPWISGGIEFNWPQHHRPTTFMPVDWRIDDHADGRKTIWCAEIEPMFNTKGMHGFTLHPDRAYLEIDVHLYNRTAEPQTFLWWANPAVHVDDGRRVRDYQSIFPPDVHAVMDHGKRDVSDFPIATGTYYKVNYAPGTDISRYKNIPVPTSFMAYHSDFDFIGCYDHGQQAGMIHVANHHVVPGKKQWTWGTSDFGQAWDRQLTDEDGPYIELMCGAYTDNQPDFSWLMPGEEKRFTQIFMPFKEIGGIKNASREAAVNLEIQDDGLFLGVYVTALRTVRVTLHHGGDLIFAQTATLSPETALTVELPRPGDLDPQSLVLRVLADDRELISFSPLPSQAAEIPAPAAPARPPHEIASVEELFLNGLHLEQYRHATYAPEPYYEEALRRDPLDSRCNNALGLLLYRRGKFTDAEPYFRRAVDRLTERNPNPYDGEPFYNLGLSLKMQGRYAEAVDAFYKAVWNAAWQDAAYFELARLTCRAGQLNEALDLLRRALFRNWTHHKARHLRVAILRRLGRHEDALHESEIALDLDRLEYGALWERFLLRGDADFAQTTRGDLHTYIELALDYAHAALFDEAVDLLNRAPQDAPLVHYYRGWVHTLAGDEERALASFEQAAATAPQPTFPNRLEAVLALEAAMRLNPGDARAPFNLGNFWYAHRRYDEAIACWERARDLDPHFPTVQRNLGLAYFNKQGDAAAALHAYETAFALDPSDGRVLFELDQLYKKLNRPPHQRLAFLGRHAEQVNGRDDLVIETISLLNLLGRHEEAYTRLMARSFHPWEGGEGKTTTQYVWSLVQMARRALDRGDFADAIDLLERAQIRPHSLGEGKLFGAQENQIFYFLGCAYAGMGERAQAEAAWQRASVGLSEPTSPLYYNDQPPDMIYYQGLARRQLGRPEDARLIFQKLVDYGRAHLDDAVTMDYFAVSLPDFLVFEDNLSDRNRIHCHYMMALGHLGLGEDEAARQHFGQVLALDASHLGATIHSPYGGEKKV
jgi:tetratricopeptide (TPR) repeat protein